MSWWRHQMETFPALLAFFMGIRQSSVDSHHNGQWRGTLMFCFICAWTNGWANDQDAGDLRRHHALYDVTVMVDQLFALICHDVVWRKGKITRNVNIFSEHSENRYKRLQVNIFLNRITITAPEWYHTDFGCCYILWSKEKQVIKLSGYSQ